MKIKCSHYTSFIVEPLNFTQEITDIFNMAYDEKYRKRAVEYKDKGHTFKQLKEAFGIHSSDYYRWKRNMEEYGAYKPPITEKRTRKRKIDPVELKKFVEQHPDLFLKET